MWSPAGKAGIGAVTGVIPVSVVEVMSTLVTALAVFAVTPVSAVPLVEVVLTEVRAFALVVVTLFTTEVVPERN